MNRKHRIAVVVLACLGAGQAHALNLLLDGGFEGLGPNASNSLGSNWTTQYSYADALNEIYTEGFLRVQNGFAANNQANFGHHLWANTFASSGSGFLIVNGDNAQSFVLTQSFVSGAGSHTVSFDHANLYLPGPNTQLQLLIDNVVVDTLFTSSTSTAWFTYSNNFNLAAGNHTFTVKGLTTVLGGNDFALDNFGIESPQAVPEPFTMGLGIAGVALALKRRAKSRQLA